MGYPCASRNTHVHIVGAMILSAVTTSTLVELLVFMSCFLLGEAMTPLPIKKVEPM